jgi:hypothetical protein
MKYCLSYNKYGSGAAAYELLAQEVAARLNGA